MQSGLDLETLDLILGSIDEFAARHLSDARILELDHEDECPLDVVRGMCGEELGIQLLFIADEYGGMGGNTLDVTRVCERMAGIDIGVATSVLATFLGSGPIQVGGTEEQRAHWIGRIAEEGLLFDYAVGSVGWGGRVSNPDNTAGSQFFVITGSRFTDLSRTYGYLGTVTSGLDVAQRIEGYAPASGEGKPTRDVTITKVTITVA